MNSSTVKDAYPLPRIDDSLRLLGNQPWFSTMDSADIGFERLSYGPGSVWHALATMFSIP